MNKVIFLNSNKSYINKNILKLNDFEILSLNLKDIEANLEIKIDKSNLLYNEYIKFLYIYENGGLLLDGKYEIYKNIDNFIKNDAFLGFEDINKVGTNIIWSKEKKNVYFKKILNLIEIGEFDDITKLISKVLSKNLDNTNNALINIENKLYLYPYDYFYPIDYEKSGKNFTENMTTILYKESNMSFKNWIKLKFIKIVGNAGYIYIYNLLKIIKNKLFYNKYIKNERLGKNKSNEYKKKNIQSACEKLEEYFNKNLDYVVIHNPKWLGVTSATKELFRNLIPLEEIYSEDDAENIANRIVKLQVEQVIFSAFADGWELLAKKIKEKNPNIKIKCFWHGSHSQVIDTINWRTNVEAIKLHKLGIIDVFATCKESIINFYKSQNYKTHFIKNTVRIDDKLLNEINQIKGNAKKESNIKIGIYAAGMSWRKNMFNQIAASSLIDNAIIDSVPLNFIGQVFASRLNTTMVGNIKGIKREELLKRMSLNDINLYVTFSECAPMLPIESMEVGVICLTGDTNHYFKNTKLEKYLVVNREDDVIEINKKIIFALEHKDEIFKLYKEWKLNYDIESVKSVEDFLKIN